MPRFPPSKESARAIRDNPSYDELVKLRCTAKEEDEIAGSRVKKKENLSRKIVDANRPRTDGGPADVRACVVNQKI